MKISRALPSREKSRRLPTARVAGAGYPNIMRVILALALLAGTLGAAKPDFYLHDGDNVVFYGDSITAQRLYTIYTETFILTRFPNLRIHFVHSGFGGDRVSGGLGGTIDERLRRDVFAYRPTVITIMLGMNDGEYHPFDPEIFRRYSDGYTHILEKIKTELPKTRVTLLEPSAYDDVTRPPTFEGGYNSVLRKFGVFVREVGKSNGLAVADLNQPVIALLRAANEVAPDDAKRLIVDRVHPSPGVHLVMAGALLKAWGASSLVTSVEIDSAARTATEAENTTVEDIAIDGDLTWRQLDRSLPMVVEQDEATLALALRCSDFTETLNQQMLKITGLAEGAYRLRIDDDFIGSFTAEQLSAGINLATRKTPMSKQAQSVLGLTYRHNHLHFARWGMVETALKDYDLKKVRPAVDSLDALEDEVIALQRATAQPKPHQYWLTKE
jgi:lysophospholipase L1-like esterase